MPDKVQANYSLDMYDQRLKGIILSKYGLYRGGDKTPIDTNCFDAVDDLQLCICKDCKDDMVAADRRTTTTSTATNNFVSRCLSPYDPSSCSDSETDLRSQSNASPSLTRMCNRNCC